MALVVSIPNGCNDALAYTFEALYNKRIKHRKLPGLQNQNCNPTQSQDNASYCWVEHNTNQTLVVINKSLLSKCNGDVDHMFEAILSPMLKDTLKHL